MKYVERFFHVGLLVFGLILLALIARPAFAQEGCLDAGDGPVAAQKSGVKKIGDAFTVSWTAPTELADVACTPIASDPAFAVTSYEVYIEVDAPAQSGVNFPPVATLPPTQTSFSGTLNFDGVRPGSDVFYAVAACNQFGCSSLSEQKWHKLGGPPGKARSLSVE